MVSQPEVPRLRIEGCGSDYLDLATSHPAPNSEAGLVGRVQPRHTLVKR